MTTTLPMARSVRFHLSLNVADLTRSVAFYRVVFGTEPLKLRPDYAKFELDDPAIVLSLEPTAPAAGGPLNHLGFRMADAGSLVAMQARLEGAGIHSQREEGVECCYARQTKFWVQDPDRTLWEIYTLEEDLEHRGAGQTIEAMMPSVDPSVSAEPVIWEHRMGQSIPPVIPLATDGADQVRLRGTFNLPLSLQTQKGLLGEVRRILKPGGRLFVDVLVGDRPLGGPPDLPGPAAVVQHVPLQSEPVQLLEHAGFDDIRLLKFDAKPCFVRQGVEMREMQLEGWKDGASSPGFTKVLYKGPFRQVSDDVGNVFPRGQWNEVPVSVANRLGRGPMSESFVILS